MRRLPVLVLTGVVMMSGCATSYRAGARNGAVGVIAHRGASQVAPENTMAAFSLAHKMKADWFELDCTLSKDGEVIVIHDDTLDRTTNGKGPVRDQTLADLKKLDAGAWKDPEFAGERLPMLAEALDFAKANRIGVYIEVKNFGDDKALMNDILEMAKDCPSLTPVLRREVMQRIEASGTANVELTRKVIRLVRERRMKRRVVIQSFSPIVCAIARAEARDLRTELLGNPDKDDPGAWERLLGWAYLLDVAGVNPCADAVTPGRLAPLHQAGKTVAVWTVDDPDVMRRLAAWGADSIITDCPDLCLQTLHDFGKR